jgi:hypothetical protein
MRSRIIAVLAGLALVSCKSDPPPKPIVESNVELVQRGAVPQRVLRYHIAKGTATTVEVGIEADVMGRKSPSITTTLAMLGDDVLPDGRMVVRSTVKSTRAKTPDGSDVPAELVSVFDGISIIATVSPVGTLSDTKLDMAGKTLPPELDAQVQALTKSFEQVAMVLPDGPVGVGASWKTRKTIEQNKMTMTAVTTITVTAIDGDKISFTRSSAISGPDQTLVVPPQSVLLKNIAGTGTAKGTVDLAKFAITSEANDEYHADAADPATPTQLDKLSVSMKMTLTAK